LNLKIPEPVRKFAPRGLLDRLLGKS